MKTEESQTQWSVDKRDMMHWFDKCRYLEEKIKTLEDKYERLKSRIISVNSSKMVDSFTVQTIRDTNFIEVIKQDLIQSIAKELSRQRVTITECREGGSIYLKANIKVLKGA